jgi:hypothetical protein
VPGRNIDPRSLDAQRDIGPAFLRGHKLCSGQGDECPPCEWIFDNFIPSHLARLES